LKVQIVADKFSERIICTNVFNGKAHDGTIFKKTLRLDPTILALLDSGYRGVQKVHANVLYPLRHKEDIAKMPEEERKTYNKIIASLRMKIEHIIGCIKRYKILSEKYRNRRKRFGLRLNLIAGFYNSDLAH